MIVNLHNIGIINDNQINIDPFTLLTGKNNSGKSSILSEIEKQNKSVRRFKHIGLSFFKYDFKSDPADILLFEHPENDLYPDFRNNSILYFLNYNSISNISNIVNVPIDLTIGIEIEEPYDFFNQYAFETECIINACLENYKLKKGTKNGL